MSCVIALTGATGFIGSAVARRLLAKGCRIRALIRPVSGKSPMPGQAIHWVEGDLEDMESLRRLVRGASDVVHCAGAVRGATRNHFNRVNAEGVGRLVHAATGRKTVRRFLLISSLAAREPHLSSYAASKRLGEKILIKEAGEMPWAALRPPAVYGPGDRELTPLFRWMGRGMAPVLGAGRGRFSMLFVDDLAAAVTRWLDCGIPEQRLFELHDGHTGGYTWADVAATVTRLCSKPVVQVKIPLSVLNIVARVNLAAARTFGYMPMLTPGKVRELQHPDWVCDNARFFQDTGWTPRVSLEQGLRETMGWGRRAD